MSTSPGRGLCGVLTAMAFGLRNCIQREREREGGRGETERKFEYYGQEITLFSVGMETMFSSPMTDHN
jgi:hypothetical protein